MIKSLSITVLALLVSASAFAGSEVIQKNAKQVSGFDKVSNAEATDCTYIAGKNGVEQNVVLVGVNSKSAPFNNALVRIPEENLPLQDGFKTTDYRGNKISYSNGVLQAKRQTTGEGSANETVYLELNVSADLTQVSSAKVEKLEGLIIKRTLSQIECVF